MVMLTPTPEGKAPGSLSETGRGLQLTEEDWIPPQLSILNKTIFLQIFLFHKLAGLSSLLLMQLQGLTILMNIQLKELISPLYIRLILTKLFHL